MNTPVFSLSGAALTDGMVHPERPALRVIADGTPGGLTRKSPHGAATPPADIAAPDGAQSRTAAAPSIRDTRPRASSVAGEQ